MARLRVNFIVGFITADLPAGSGFTALHSDELAQMPAITTPDYAVAIIGDEICWITAHTSGATTATVLRGQEGTDPNQLHVTGDRWEHGPTVFDFTDSVHLDGNETITGVKTFSVSPIVPTPSTSTEAANKTYVDTVDATNVHKTGAETIAGVKTFSASPVVPDPVSATEVANKDYVDTVDATTVHLTGAETIAGVKTFSASPVVPTPVNPTDAANKDYIDTNYSPATNVVHLTGAETITGHKTFSTSPTVPSPTSSSDAASRGYVDTTISTLATDSNVVHVTGNETIAGTKTFTSGPVFPDASIAEAKITNLVTDLANAAAQQQMYFVVSPASGGGYQARNRDTGLIQFTHADPAVLTMNILNWLKANTNGVGSIYYSKGTYTWGSSGNTTVPTIPSLIGYTTGAPIDQISGMLYLKADPGAKFVLTSFMTRLFNIGNNNVVNDYDTYMNFVIDGFNVDGGGQGQGLGARHVIVGTTRPSGGTYPRINMANIWIKNCSLTNIPVDPTNVSISFGMKFDGFVTGSTDVNPSDTSLYPFAGQIVTFKNIIVEDYWQYGGNAGVYATGSNSSARNSSFQVPLLYDNIHVHRCKVILAPLAQTQGFITNSLSGAVSVGATDTLQSASFTNYPAHTSSQAWTISVTAYITSDTDAIIPVIETMRVQSHTAGSDTLNVTRGFNGTVVAHSVGEVFKGPTWGGPIQLGSANQGGYAHISDCYVYGSGDIGYETDCWDFILIENSIAEDCQGSGFYHTNFAVPRNPSEQIVKYVNCHYRRTQAFRGFGFNTGMQLEKTTKVPITLGNVIYDNCSYFRGGAGATDFGNSGEAWKLNAQANSYIVKNAHITLKDFNVNFPVGAGVTNAMIYIGNNGAKSITIKDIDINVVGQYTQGNAAFYNILIGAKKIYYAAPSITTYLNIDNVSINNTIAGMGTLGNIGIVVNTGIINGIIRNVKFPIVSGSTRFIGVQVADSSSLTIPDALYVENNDYTNCFQSLVQRGAADNYSKVFQSDHGLATTTQANSVIVKTKSGTPNDADFIGGAGVMSGLVATPKSPADKHVHIASGQVFVGGAFINISAQDVLIPDPDSTYGRMDFVVATSGGTLSVVSGSLPNQPTFIPGYPGFTTTSIPIASIGWNVPGPTGVTATLASGGTLTAGTPYYYTITAILDRGETKISSEVTVTPTSSNKKAVISWGVETFASGYNIYRSTTSGSYNGGTQLLTTVASDTLTYTDDGSVSLTTGAPPTLTAVSTSMIVDQRKILTLPSDGLIEVDNAAGLMYVRSGGVWKQVGADFTTPPIVFQGTDPNKKVLSVLPTTGQTVSTFEAGSIISSQDQFTRGVSTVPSSGSPNQLGSTDTGQAYSIFSPAQWGINSSNKAYMNFQAGASSTESNAYYDAGLTDYVLIVKVNTSPTRARAGASFKLQNSTNRFNFYIREYNGTFGLPVHEWQLRIVDNNSTRTLAQATSNSAIFNLNSSYLIKIVVSGPTISCYTAPDGVNPNYTFRCTYTVSNADFFNGSTGYNAFIANSKVGMYMSQDGTNGTDDGVRDDGQTTFSFVEILAPSFIVDGSSVPKLSGAVLTAGTSIADGSNVSLGTTTGTKFGTSTTQKLSFFNATPITQPANTTDLKTALMNLGLMASGGSVLIATSGSPAGLGSASAGTSLQAAAFDHVHPATFSSLTTNSWISDDSSAVATFTTGSTNGTKFGINSTTSKLSFFGSTPIVQPTGDILSALKNLGLLGGSTNTLNLGTASGATLTAGTLAVGSSGQWVVSNSGIQQIVTSSTWLLTKTSGSDTGSTMAISTSGFQMGPGGSSAADTSITRTSTNTLTAGGRFNIAGNSSSIQTLLVTGASGQTADLIVFRDNSNNQFTKWSNVGLITHYQNALFSKIAKPSPTATVGISSGSGTTYSYKVTAINANGMTVASSATTIANGTLGAGTGTNVITWAAINGATSYNIYGRTAGSEALIGTVAGTSSTATFTDDGSVTPTTAAPTTASGNNKLQLQVWDSPASTNVFEIINGSSSVIANIDTSGVVNASGWKSLDSSAVISFTVGTTNGTQFGVSTSSKLAFYGATPIVKPTGGTDLLTALSNLGLVASGNTPLNLGTGALSAGIVTAGGAIDATAQSIQIKSGAGAPTDASFSVTPSNGMLYYDTTNNRFYVRNGTNTWKAVQLS